MEEAVRSIVIALGAVVFVAALTILLHYIMAYEKTYNEFLSTLGDNNVIIDIGDMYE